jgi:hypothetical protein
MTKTATPPTTPPMIAPRFEDEALLVLDEVLDGDAPATEDDAVIPVAPRAVDVSELVEFPELVSVTGGVFEPADVSEVMEESVGEGTGIIVDESVDKTAVDCDKVDVEEVLMVLGVPVLGKFVIVNVNESSPSPSGQIPVVHGSLEQHPRKFPAVQTYHCLTPVQLFTCRGTRDSRDSRDSIPNNICKYQVSFTESEASKNRLQKQQLF